MPNGKGMKIETIKKDGQPAAGVTKHVAVGCCVVGEFGSGTKKLVPAGVNSLNCHFNWMSFYSISETSKRILQESIRNFPEVEVSKSETIRAAQKLSHLVWSSVFAHLDKDTARARKDLNEARELLGSPGSEFPKLLVEYMRAFRYLVHANRAVLASNMGDRETAEEARREAVNVNIKDPKTRGLLLCCKAAFLGFLGDREAHVEQMREALKLDPNVPEYSESLFLALRRIRRERDPCAGPSEEEISLMEKAVVLAPAKLYTLNSITTLYQDILIARFHNLKYTCPGLTEFGIEGIVLKMKNFARQVWFYMPDSVEAGLRLGEILLFNKDGRIPNKYHMDKATLAEATEQYAALELKWPQNSDVLHAIGKFYSMFPNSADPQEGILYLEGSLLADPGNLAALMDYFRYAYPFPRSQNPTRAWECIEKIDFHLEACRAKSHLISKLSCWKATLLCKEHKFEEAMKLWYKAVELNPELMHTNTFPLFGRPVFNGLFESNDYKLLLNFLKEVDEKPMVTVNQRNLLARLREEI